MLGQLRAAARTMSAREVGMEQAAPGAAAKPGFATALKESLDRVNASQAQAQELGRQFAMGDDKVSLSDVMIASQKASIQFQATVQVRNKMVAAYQDIMSMSI